MAKLKADGYQVNEPTLRVMPTEYLLVPTDSMLTCWAWSPIPWLREQVSLAVPRREVTSRFVLIVEHDLGLPSGTCGIIIPGYRHTMLQLCRPYVPRSWRITLPHDTPDQEQFACAVRCILVLLPSSFAGGRKRPFPISCPYRRHRLVGTNGGSSGKRGAGDIGLDEKYGGRHVRDTNEGVRAIVQYVGRLLHNSGTS